MEISIHDLGKRKYVHPIKKILGILSETACKETVERDIANQVEQRDKTPEKQIISRRKMTLFCLHQKILCRKKF